MQNDNYLREKYFFEACSAFKSKDFIQSIKLFQKSIECEFVGGSPYTDLQIKSNMAMAYSSIKNYDIAHKLLIEVLNSGFSNPSIVKEINWLETKLNNSIDLNMIDGIKYTLLSLNHKRFENRVEVINDYAERKLYISLSKSRIRLQIEIIPTLTTKTATLATPNNSESLKHIYIGDDPDFYFVLTYKDYDFSKITNVLLERKDKNFSISYLVENK